MTQILFIFFFIGFWFLTNINKRNTDFERYFQRLLLFSLIFPIIFLINLYHVILGVKSFFLIKLFFYLLVIFGIYKFVKKIDIKKILNFRLEFKLNSTYFIYIYFFLYFIITLFFFPSDEDSLRYHLAIAKKIINHTFYENIWLDYIVLGTNEFLSAFGLLFNFENFISFTNIIYIFFIYKLNLRLKEYLKLEYNNINFLLLISAPYFISLFTSQKFYLLPSFIVTYSLIYLYISKNLNLINFYLLSFLNIFAVASKATFLPYSLVFFAWSLFKIKDYQKYIIFCFHRFYF